VPRTREQKTKDNILRVNDGVLAEGMLKMLGEIKAGLEQDLLRRIAIQPASDLMSIQYEYKACQKIADKLQSKINSGAIAKKQLNKEE
jgi:hypothetical protein